MTEMSRKCIDCRTDISHRGNRSYRCCQCQRMFRLNYKKRWNINKGDSKLTKLGNPIQDNHVLEFFRKKRAGIKTKSYKSLPDSAFYKSNEAD